MSAAASPRRPRRRASATGKATLADVSNAAGVSTATVSRMMNAPDLVNEETRRVIQREIDRLGYSPNGAARALAARRTRTIGVIIPSINNLLSARVLEGFQRVLDQNGYELLLTSFEYDPTVVPKKAENFVRHGVDAIFIVSAQHDEALYGFLERSRVPFVTTWPAAPGRPVPSIAYDHCAAAVGAVNYLLDLGHRDIGLITGGRTGNPRLVERQDATRRLLASRGVQLPPERVVDVGSYDLASARQAFRVLISRGKLPTAIIASNDIIAGGVVLECQAQGIAVPGDVSVTGFGDLEIAAQLSPSLTTIRTPRAELGTKAAEFLLRRLAGKDAIEHTVLDVELIVRESTSIPRRDAASTRMTR